jgi:hypothetical protein
MHEPGQRSIQFQSPGDRFKGNRKAVDRALPGTFSSVLIRCADNNPAITSRSAQTQIGATR